ncbi:hypothetical protein [Flavobacterium sediminis]|uniref:hypothetical protein n=1 Tax=Flavobacterium sediminis TaxID=2201181 RepID=UPI0011B22D3E|nr:hypothetical protein [Flavobacterium sediminis]
MRIHKIFITTILLWSINSFSQTTCNIGFANQTQGWDFYLLDGYNDPNVDISDPSSGSLHVPGGTTTLSNSTASHTDWFIHSTTTNLNNTGINFTGSLLEYRQSNIQDVSNYTTFSKGEEFLNADNLSYNFYGFVVFKQSNGNKAIVDCLNETYFRIKVMIETNGTSTTYFDLLLRPNSTIPQYCNEITTNDPDYRIINYNLPLNIQNLVNFCDSSSKVIVEMTTSEIDSIDPDEGHFDISSFYNGSCLGGGQVLIELTNPVIEDQFCMNTPYALIEPTFNGMQGSGYYKVECTNCNPQVDDTFSTSTTNYYSFSAQGTYTVSYIYTGTEGCEIVKQKTVNIIACTPCLYCTSFELIQGKEYSISGWTSLRNDDVNFEEVSFTNFNDALIEMEFLDAGGSQLSVNSFFVSGKIIDGWQKISGRFIVPVGAADMEIKLINNSSKVALFDDIRVYPKDGTMKSFVYDQETKRLMAELDENNYATFYEYDKEGGLVRVKKETEKGVYTIQETRSSTVKKDN